jgi:hypothetical protein
MADCAEGARLLLPRGGGRLVGSGADGREMGYLHKAAAEVRDVERRLGAVVAAAARVENNVAFPLAEPKLIFKLKFGDKAPPVAQSQPVVARGKGAKRLCSGGVLLPQGHERLARLGCGGG